MCCGVVIKVTGGEAELRELQRGEAAMDHPRQQFVRTDARLQVDKDHKKTSAIYEMFRPISHECAPGSRIGRG